MKKILVTGSNGFIGRNLTEHLSKKHIIFSPKRQELDLLDDIKVKEYLKSNKFDVIIHSATLSTLEREDLLPELLEKNLRMFFNIERCSEHYDKMYYFGSGAEYDMNNYIPMMKEDYFDKFVPKDPYGFSKYIMSKYAQSNNKIFNLRLFGVFGKYENYRCRFISNAICKVLLNQPVKIRQNVYFDYLYIDDLVKIMEWFIENEPSKNQYNLATGKKIDLLSIVKMVEELSKKEIDVEVLQDGLKQEYTCDNGNLLSELGGYEFITMEKAITYLFEYYKSIQDDILL